MKANRILFTWIVFFISVLATSNLVSKEAADGFKIFGSEFQQSGPAVAYNYLTDEFLVVCGESRSGVTAVMGQFVKPDGSLSGSPFTICLNPGPYPNPSIATNLDNEYMVVWVDVQKDKDYDIHGARLNSKGKKLVGANTLADTTFIVCDHDSSQYEPVISFNFRDICFLVVWTDYRNSYLQQEKTYSYQTNSDIYGQRLSWDGKLLSPMDPPGTKVNFPVAANREYDEYANDVAYYGKNGFTPDEWLVVYSNYSLTEHNGLVWGVRVNGKDGYLLDTWGAPIEPGKFGKASQSTGGGPPWLPQFPIGDYPPGYKTGSFIYQGSPHVESNAIWYYFKSPVEPRKINPIPEFFVVWSEFASPGNIKGQRVAYFPDSTAYRMKLKEQRGKIGQFTAVLLDSLGKPPAVPSMWITWPNFLICNEKFEQSYNNIAYNPVEGEFLTLWNDWRKTGWDGSFSGAPVAPQADIYGQRIYLDPDDLSVRYLDALSAPMKNRSTNIPYLTTSADEGNDDYPAAAWGRSGNHFLAVLEYDDQANDKSIDIAGALITGAPTAVKRKLAPARPEGYLLAANYPNPMNPGTTIEFTLPTAERTVVRIFDALGRNVATLFEGRLEAGSHSVQWNGRDASGRDAATGVYVVRIEAGEHQTTHKMALVK